MSARLGSETEIQKSPKKTLPNVYPHTHTTPQPNSLAYPSLDLSPSLSDVTMVIGEVGGAVTIPCASDPWENHLVFMYVQRPGSNGNDSQFINGYHSNKPLDPKEYTNRTYVDHIQRTMKLWNILLSDEGLYECHIQYQTKQKQENIRLNVTGNITSVQTLFPCLFN